MNSVILFLLALTNGIASALTGVTVPDSGERVLRVSTGRTGSRPRNYLGKCKACGAKHAAVDAVRINVAYQDARHTDTRHDYAIADATRIYMSRDGGGKFAKRCDCGKTVSLTGVRGVFKPEHVCNAKCMSSTGPACECSCGGRNHGRAFVAVRA